jgi:hypothetical protein
MRDDVRRHRGGGVDGDQHLADGDGDVVADVVEGNDCCRRRRQCCNTMFSLQKQKGVVSKYFTEHNRAEKNYVSAREKCSLQPNSNEQHEKKIQYVENAHFKTNTNEQHAKRFVKVRQTNANKQQAKPL